TPAAADKDHARTLLVCDPDTGATRCPFHLKNQGNGELVSGTESDWQITRTRRATKHHGSFTSDARVTRGKGTGDTTGLNSTLYSIPRTEPPAAPAGTVTATFLYRLDLTPKGHGCHGEAEHEHTDDGDDDDDDDSQCEGTHVKVEA